MLKNSNLDELREKLSNSLFKPVNNIRLHGYFTKFNPSKLTPVVKVSLVNLWIKLMESGVWKPGGTIDNPEIYIDKGLQLTDIGIMINNRVPSGREFVNLINVLSISDLENEILSIDDIVYDLSKRIEFIISVSPNEFKGVEPEWCELQYYLSDKGYPTERGIVESVKEMLIDKFNFKDEHQFQSERYYSPHDDRVLYDLIHYSYFHAPDQSHYMDFMLSHPLYKYALKHLNWYQSQDYLENNSNARYITPYLSALNKMWYRFINDGDMMESIEEDCIMIGINAITALEEISNKDKIILLCFHNRIIHLESYLRYSGDTEDLDEFNRLFNSGKSKSVWITPYQFKDIIEVINGEKDDDWFNDQDDINILDYIASDNLLTDSLYIMISIGDAFRVYPDFLKSAPKYDFYGPYIH